MKSLTLIFGTAVAITLASCGQQTYPTGTPSPYPSPYPDRRTSGDYPDDRVIYDEQGRVISRDGRERGNSRNLPQGQGRKGYGSKSAKVYAPGQQKKQGKYYGNGNGSAPQVITVDDRYVQRDSQGRLYYVDQNGNTYYRGSDGRYYLSSQSNQGSVRNNGYDNRGKGKANSNGKGRGKGRN
ncbi:MAG: hypothetical protein JWQ96_316 [Segetibacter sp.]|nr:hypothetical protein [Segetibacter sp.]